MNQLKKRDKWLELVVGLVAASALALGLWAVGLPEVSWAPFLFTAAASSRPVTRSDPSNRGVRS